MNAGILTSLCSNCNGNEPVQTEPKRPEAGLCKSPTFH